MIDAPVPLDIPPGVVTDDTTFDVGAAAWVDADKVRFDRNRAQLIGGWEKASLTKMTGVCRGGLTFIDNAGSQNTGFGTHSNLYVFIAGDLVDITPSGLSSGLIDSTGGQGYGTGAYSGGTWGTPSTVDTVARTWSLATWGENLLACPRDGTVYRWENDIDEDAASIGRTVEVEDDFSGYADNTELDVEWTRGTGWDMDAANDQVDCDGSQASDSDLKKGSYGLTVGKWYRVEVDFSNRSAGTILAFGDGNEGTASDDASGTVTVQFLANNASADVGARGDSDFTGSVDEIRIIELNAPDQVRGIVTTPQAQVLALGCNEELTNTFNPRCIRWCAIDNLNAWASLTSNNAGEDILECNGVLVAGRGTAYGTFIWTTDELYFATFVGAGGQTYEFTPLGVACGLAGPNACMVVGNTAYWMSRDGEFWTCAAGGEPVRLTSPVADTVAQNLSTNQQAKIYAAYNGRHDEVWWFYPDSRDGDECSRYVSFSRAGQGWSSGQLARTTFVPAQQPLYPLGVAYDADNDESTIYYHERGNTADGGVLSGSVTTGYLAMQNGARWMQVNGMWPDIKDQVSPMSLTVLTKDKPQDTATEKGPYTIAVGDDRVHFRASGRLVAFKFEISGVGAFFRLGKINVGMKARGRR